MWSSPGRWTAVVTKGLKCGTSQPPLVTAPELLPFTFNILKSNLSQAPVAHACNPSYSSGRYQDNHGLKPAQANSSQDPILKIPNTQKKGWWSGSRRRSSVQAPALQKKIFLPEPPYLTSRITVPSMAPCTN
jgi:hypothetical protein